MAKAKETVRMGDKYTLMIDGHNIMFVVENLSADCSEELTCTLSEKTSLFSRSARKLDFSIRDLIGREMKKYVEPEYHNNNDDDDDDGLGAFSPNYYGW